MPDEEESPAMDHDPAKKSGVPMPADDEEAAGQEMFPTVAAAVLPPTRAEFDRLAAEVRRLAEQLAHGRS